jgi:hypothetical protein
MLYGAGADNEFLHSITSESTPWLAISLVLRRRVGRSLNGGGLDMELWARVEGYDIEYARNSSRRASET